MPEKSTPVATVPVFTRRKRRLKKARGFSLGELAQTGLQASQARSFGIRMDQRRSTIHPQNVAALQAFLDASPPETGTPQSSVEPASEGSKLEGDSVPAEKASRRRRTKPTEKQAS